MEQLNKLYLLVHGLCYAEMTFGCPADSVVSARYAPFVERELACAARWRSRLESLGDDEALVIIPPATASGRPADNFSEAAALLLGDRCFILQCPDITAPEFWSGSDEVLRQAV